METETLNGNENIKESIENKITPKKEVEEQRNLFDDFFFDGTITMEQLNRIYKQHTRKNNSYSLEFKVNIVKFINNFKGKDRKSLSIARKKIIKKFAINKSVLSRWETDFHNFKDELNLKAKRKAGAGRKSTLELIEKDILFWLIHVRKAGFSVTTKSLIAYLYSLNEQFQKKPIDIIRQRVQRILKKNHLSIKKLSQFGKPLPKEVKQNCKC